MKAYVDADILIWHLRGDPRALEFLQRLRKQRGHELWLGAMQRAEIVFFMRKNEEAATLALLTLFHTAPVDQPTVDLAGELYRKWHRSHGSDPNDALLAATVLRTGGKLFTLNDKHFPMPDLVVERPW